MPPCSQAVPPWPAATDALPQATGVEDAVITYSGTMVNRAEDGSQSEGTATITADCSTGSCLVSTTATFEGNTFDPLRGEPVAVTDGLGTFERAQTGDVCDRTYRGQAEGTVELTRGEATIVINYEGSELVNCGSTSSEYQGGVITLAGALTEGDPCHLFDECVEPEPESAPTAEPVVAEPQATTVRGADDPSILSALPTVAEAATVRGGVWATAMAVILVLLLTLPTTLLNSAIKKGTDRFDDWALTLSKRSGKFAHRLGRLAGRLATLEGWKACAMGIIAASLISSLIDPEFGINAASVRTVLSIFVSLALKITLSWLLLIWIVTRTHPRATAKFEFRPLTLLAVVIAVILTRVTGFEPGIIFGLVAGLTFGSLLATAEKAKVALFGLALGYGISVVAWLSYSLLAMVPEPGAALLYISETLSSLTIAGIVALPLALIPVPGMTGHTIWAWNRRAWAAAYLIGLFAFFLILMPMPFSWAEVPLSLTVWVALFIGYTVVALAAWLLITRPWKASTARQAGASQAADEPEGVDAD